MFLNLCKQIFHIPHVHISQKGKGALMWNLADFQICISVPLMQNASVIEITHKNYPQCGLIFFDCVKKTN